MAIFPKSERIQSKLVLEKVYNEGELIKKYPFRLKYLMFKDLEGPAIQIVISIPKRLVKKATARNRIRRQIKEIYRLNKSDLLSQCQNKKGVVGLFLIYTGKENEPYSYLESKLKVVLKELEEKI